VTARRGEGDWGKETERGKVQVPPNIIGRGGGGPPRPSGGGEKEKGKTRVLGTE